MGGALTAMLGRTTASGAVGSQTPSLRAQGYRSANVSYTLDTKAPLNTDDFDPSSIFDTSNNNILPTLSGYYLVGGFAELTTTAAIEAYGYNAVAGVSRNLGSFNSTTQQQGSGGAALFYCDGASDTIELRANRGGTLQGTAVHSFLNALGPFNKTAFQVASAYRSTSQTGSSGSLVKFTSDTASFDPSSIFSTSNSRFTPTVAGYYIVGARVEDNGFSQNIADLVIYKNGSAYQKVGCKASAKNVAMGGHCIVYLNGSTDYVEAYFDGSTLRQPSFQTFFEIVGPFNATVAISYLSGSGSLSSGTTSKVTQDATLVDTSSIWNSTNKRFIPNAAGYYWCSGRMECTTEATHELVAYKNGSTLSVIGGYSQSSTYGLNGDGVLVYCNGSTDYIELYSYRSSSGTLQSGSDKTWFAMVGPF